MRIERERIAGCFVSVVFGFAGHAIGQTVNEDTKLFADELVLAGRLGHAVAIDNGRVVAGSPLAFNNGDIDGTVTGSVYVFDPATGAEVGRLVPGDGASNDQFGFSVDIDGGIIAVGARADDDSGLNAGSAYLFDATTGAFLFKLQPSDIAAQDEFGYSIAIDDGVVVVGARLNDAAAPDAGAAYLFDAATGLEIMRLVPSTTGANDQFGTAVSIDGGVVAVGTPGAVTNVSGDGAAFLFDATTGAQLHKLLADDAGLNDLLGNAVAVSDGLVVVGAQWDNDAGNNSGSAYIFDAATGNQLQKLLPVGGGPNDEFGSSVAIDDGVVIVGSNLDTGGGSTSCYAYAFDAATGAQLAELIASDGVAGDGFGKSVAIENGSAIVGANYDDFEPFLPSRGSAYVLSVGGAACPPDLTGDGVLNFFDVSAFISAFTMGDLIADFTNDGVLNFFDIDAFLSAFLAGCP